MSTINGGPGEDDRWDWSPAGAGREASVVVPDFGSFMRQVFPEAEAGETGPGALVAAASQRPGILRRDYETAFMLLQRASDAFPALLQHCQQLEADLRRARAEAQDEVRAAHGETQQWHQIALAMKMHIEENEHQIALLRKRVAVAEERLAAGQNLASAAEQQASIAIGITTLFHDKIIDAFGVGSAAHAALDAVAQGALRGADGLPREPG